MSDAEWSTGLQRLRQANQGEIVALQQQLDAITAALHGGPLPAVTAGAQAILTKRNLR